MRPLSILLGGVLIVGCADATMPEANPILVHAARVRAVNFQFMEQQTSIPAGDTIYFAITSGTHSVVFDVAGAPDSVPTTAATVIAKRQFPVPGSYPFHCSRHSRLGMQGVITVTQ